MWGGFSFVERRDGWVVGWYTWRTHFVTPAEDSYSASDVTREDVTVPLFTTIYYTVYPNTQYVMNTTCPLPSHFLQSSISSY